MRDYTDTAIEVALEVGQIQLEGLDKRKNIEFKGKFNPVTEVDTACEKLIVETIKEQFPSHDILAEEGSGHDTRSDWLWLIDPLDGTVNYAHNYPLFCVSIALMHKGKLVVGVVHEPNRGELYVAEKGGGALCNKKPIRVSKTDHVENAMLSTGFAYNVAEVANNNLNHFQKFIKRCHAIRRDGVAAVDLCYVAKGRFDGFWELFLNPWDIAAGILIIQEAGGRVTNFDGSPMDIFGNEILASNGILHREMIEILKK